MTFWLLGLCWFSWCGGSAMYLDSLSPEVAADCSHGGSRWKLPSDMADQNPTDCAIKFVCCVLGRQELQKAQSFPKVQVELLGRTFCVDQQLFKETNGRGVINSTINCWISISNLLNLNLERKTNTVYKQNMQVQILRTISKYQLTSRCCYVSSLVLSLDRLWAVSGPSLWSVSLGRLIIRCPGTPLCRDDLCWTLLGGRSRDFKN
jgi:hypothetical protein